MVTGKNSVMLDPPLTLLSSLATQQVIARRMVPQTNQAKKARVNAFSLPLRTTIRLTNAGPNPFPRSSNRLNTPKAVPRVEGKVVFLSAGNAIDMGEEGGVGGGWKK